MTARADRGATSAQVLVGIALAAAIVALLWVAWQRADSAQQAPSGTAEPAPAPVSSERIDPANQGRMIEVSGRLRGTDAPLDEQFGIRAEAGSIGLMRSVEMRQWRENCVQEKCEYAQVWSGELIDSSRFRQRQDHENPQQSPFDGQLFDGGELRLGAFRFDPELAVQVLFDDEAPVPLPVRAAQLPPNLAATFGDRDGVLYTGDPDRPAVGDIRVRYEVIKPIEVSGVRGLQDGEWLKAPPPH